jgi:hypothetical protein
LIDPIDAVENPFQALICNTDAAVGNQYPHSTLLVTGDHNPTVFLRILGRVIEDRGHHTTKVDRAYQYGQTMFIEPLK